MKKSLVSLLLACAAFVAIGYGPESVRNEAGYIEVKDGELFYWLFESRSQKEKDPLVIWLSGGPGCSSMLALFAENGPYAIEDGEPVLNQNAWNSNATVIWIDQPKGTGFSRGVPVHSERQVAEDMLIFMTSFYEKYPEYSDLDLYVFAESYGGHYAPAVAAELLPHFDALKGIGIGNGLTSPEIQYKSYIPYAEDHGLVSDLVLSFMKGIDLLCEPLIAGCNRNNNTATAWTECLNAYILCNLGEITPVSSTGINTYDVRRQCGSDPLCYDFSDIDTYLNRPDVQAGLNVSKRWEECSHLVDLVMVYGGDWMKDYAADVSLLLKANKSVLIYSGEFDFMCNWMGNFAWTQALSWYGQADFMNATNMTFSTATNANAGSFISAHNFTFLKLKDAGHLAPHDQPETTLAMLQRFSLSSQGWL